MGFPNYKPDNPNAYTGKQIILNSDRILFNAKYIKGVFIIIWLPFPVPVSKLKLPSVLKPIDFCANNNTESSLALNKILS